MAADLSRRLARLERVAKPASGGLVVVFNDQPLPPTLGPGVQSLRVVFVPSDAGRRRDLAFTRHYARVREAENP